MNTSNEYNELSLAIIENVKGSSNISATIKDCLTTNEVDLIIESWGELKADYDSMIEDYPLNKDGTQEEKDETQKERRATPEHKAFAKLRTQLSNASKDVFGHGAKVVDGKLVETSTKKTEKASDSEGTESEDTGTDSADKDDVLVAYATFKATPNMETYGAFMAAAQAAMPVVAQAA